jgi:hypothetical protein
MSKINQIQNRLRELSEGEFQKLADAYLHKKGYERLNPLGSVIGADKTRKGTPDTYVSFPNGEYIFVESTTQQKRIDKKLRDDLEKCFDESLTGVPVTKIKEVVFCHTSVLEPKVEEALFELCARHGVNLNIFGIGPLSYDIYQKYPNLARDFLDIEVDTGQIVTPDEFIIANNKSKLATPLDISFHNRDR